jgi:hypothetical protein
MNKEKNKFERGPDRRGSDRRKAWTDPKDLPFPDRRKGDRRQQDRRVFSEEEREEFLKQVKKDEEKKE